MDFHISGQKINIVKEIKYLVMVIDGKANGTLTKLRHYYITPILIKTIYYAIFKSHLQYGHQLCGQTQTQAPLKNL